MIRLVLTHSAWLLAIVGLVGCAMTPGTVCKDPTGRALENPDYCKLHITHHSDAPVVACRASVAPSPRF